VIRGVGVVRQHSFCHGGLVFMMGSMRCDGRQRDSAAECLELRHETLAIFIRTVFANCLVTVHGSSGMICREQLNFLGPS
jgi:hypothetical protein